MKYLKKFFQTNFFIVFLILFGCHSPEPYIYRQTFIDRIKHPALPGWLTDQVPENCVIGIARKTSNHEKMQSAAKQMASIEYNRNHASITIEKNASRTEDDPQLSGKAEFKLNVSAFPQETKKILSRLILQDSTFLFDYYICLFSLGDQNIATKLKETKVVKSPKYFGQNLLVQNDNGLTFHSTARSSDLIKAWQKAAENARLEISNYYEKEVQTALINQDERITKDIVLETKRILSNLEIEKSFIASETRDNLQIFKVYHRFRVVK